VFTRSTIHRIPDAPAPQNLGCRSSHSRLFLVTERLTAWIRRRAASGGGAGSFSWRVLRELVILGGLALLLVGCEAKVRVESKPTPAESPSLPPPPAIAWESGTRLAGSDERRWVGVYCEAATGNRIYVYSDKSDYRPVGGIFVIPNGCAK
jgi:hypothetical protein